MNAKRRSRRRTRRLKSILSGHIIFIYSVYLGRDTYVTASDRWSKPSRLWVEQ